jgi:hypothetical protein
MAEALEDAVKLAIDRAQRLAKIRRPRGGLGLSPPKSEKTRQEARPFWLKAGHGSPPESAERLAFSKYINLVLK